MLPSIGLFIIKILLLLFILGIIILVHEFGHFIWAKTFGVHIYEFSIGMGPLLHTHKGKKDGINYNIRAIPIGGFVSMAGEVYDSGEVDENNKKIKKDKLMCNKKWWQRLIILVAGVVNNFILAIVILFIYTLIWGGGAITPKVLNVVEDKPAAAAGLKSGDVITNINGYNVSSWDKAQIILYYKNTNEYYTFEVKHTDGTKEEIKIKPEIIKDEETGAESKLFGIQIDAEDTSNVFKSFVYSIRKFNSIISSMVYTIWGLISGKIGLSALSGPVGIYEAVGETINYGINYFLYILAFLSINVGFINILPFPAFDGGHVLFLIIEKIKGSPVNAKIENTCHLIGFILVFLLMIVVTISDIIKLF
ncbi:rIP metalloprotease RseP [Mycoplasma sp. CAG:472]|jgi:RIP metalloprotease rseP|nr:rIP metalloprotease RseP [Mycoplasma sp. CAG:472]